MPIKDPIKRKEYQRKLMAQRRANGLTRNVSPNVRPDNFVSPKNSNVSPVSPKSEMLDQGLTDKPVESVSPCSRCPDLENSITNFYNLTVQEQEKVKSLKKTIQEQNKQLVIQNQKEERLLKEIERHKETINNLTYKTINESKEYSRLENSNQNQSNYQTIPKEANIIPLFYDRKHKKPIFYNCPDPCWVGQFCNNYSASSLLRD